MNPTPDLSLVITPDTIVCDSTEVTFDLSSDNGPVIGDKRYQLTVMNPGGVQGVRAPDEYSYVSGDDFIDTLINPTNQVQTVTYTFHPVIKDPRTGLAYCEHGSANDTTITIYVNPTPGINVSVPDTVVCDSTVVEFSLTTLNGAVLGEKYYYVETSYTGDVSGVTPNGHYPLANFNDRLVNNTFNLQTVTYHFIPRFRNPRGDDPGEYCSDGIDTTITIYLNPTPGIEVSIPDTIYCNSSEVPFTITTPNVSTSGTMYYDLVTSYVVAEVSGVSPDGPYPLNYDGSSNFSDIITNSHPTQLQLIEYTFKPRIDDARPGFDCDRGIDTTVRVYIAPELISELTGDTVIGGWNIRCNGLSDGNIDLFVQGGYITDDYSYLWETIDGTGLITNIQDQEGLTAGTYRVTVTDAIGCIVYDTIELEQPDPIQALDSIARVGCNGGRGGAIELDMFGGTPGYTFLWRGPEGFIDSTQNIYNRYAGIYYLDYADTNNCQGSRVILIPEPQPIQISPTLTAFGDYNIRCNGENNGDIRLNVNGQGSPAYYEYLWTGPDGFIDSTKNIYNLYAGDYTIEVTDSAGCKKEEIFNITQPDTIAIVPDIHEYPGGNYNISCYGLSDGSIDIDVTGGHGNYQYSWNTTGGSGIVANEEDQSGLTAGTYQVHLEDPFGCYREAGYELTEPPQLVLTETVLSDNLGYNVSCYGGSDGSIDVSVSGGWGSYDYEWSTTDGSGLAPEEEDQEGLAAGEYQVMVTDEINCSASWTIALDQPDSLSIGPVIPLHSGYEVSCYDGQDGSITLNPSGGVGDYTYEWSTTDGSGIETTLENQNDLSAGTYKVSVTDENGCVKSWDITLDDPEPIITGMDVENISCNASDDGMAWVDVSGGISPYSYFWIPTRDRDTITRDLPVGTYTIRITDSNGCVHYDSIDVEEPDPLKMNMLDTLLYSGSMVSCYGNSDGSFKVGVEGGRGPFIFDWFRKSGESYVPGLPVQSYRVTTGYTDSIVDVPAGYYRVLITDSKGCEATGNVRVTQPNRLLPIFNVEQVSCYGYGDGEVTVNISGGTPSYEVVWENGTRDYTAQMLPAGNQVLNITDANNCRLDTFVYVPQPDSIQISVDKANPRCPDSYDGIISVEIDGGTRPYQIFWTYLDANVPLPDNEPQLYDLGMGPYAIEIIDENNCMFHDTIVLNVDEENCIFIPNAFTPNHDGFNDTWEIDGLEYYPGVIIEVYDRWGQRVFRSDKGYSNPWKGRYRGDDLPVDSYHYIINLNNGSRPLTGNVTIIR